MTIDHSKSIQRAQAADALAAAYEAEDVIAKVHAVHELEKISKYVPVVGNRTYWDRVGDSLKHIPKALHEPALAVFANVIYLDEPLLNETMRFLARRLRYYCDTKGWEVQKDTAVFANDSPRLQEELYRHGHDYGWESRHDDSFSRACPGVTQLLTIVESLKQQPARQNIEIVQTLLRKQLWVLLTDNALSGGSISSEYVRLCELRTLFSSILGERPPIIAILAQVITDDAKRALTPLLLPGGQDWFEGGLVFGEDFKVNSSACGLFSTTAARSRVVELLAWFSEVFFLPPPQLTFDFANVDHHFAHGGDEAFQNTLDLHRQPGSYQRDFRYGWKDCGYTIVTYLNAPTNSLPVLWYPTLESSWRDGPPSAYKPPFPRNHSRIEQKRMGDGERLARILESRDAILACLKA